MLAAGTLLMHWACDLHTWPWQGHTACLRKRNHCGCCATARKMACRLQNDSIRPSQACDHMLDIVGMLMAASRKWLLM